jgi:predicted transcriptional regulator
MGARQHLTENVKLRIDSQTLRALERLAALGDRSVAAEMRRALRSHIEASEVDEEEAISA